MPSPKSDKLSPNGKKEYDAIKGLHYKSIWSVVYTNNKLRISFRVVEVSYAALGNLGTINHQRGRLGKNLRLRTEIFPSIWYTSCLWPAFIHSCRSLHLELSTSSCSQLSYQETVFRLNWKLASSSLLMALNGCPASMCTSERYNECIIKLQL